MMTHQEQFTEHWARCAAYLEPALDGTFSLGDVHEMIHDHDHIILWPLERSAVVTEILRYPKKRVCRVWLAGGDLDELRSYMPALENYARSEGCTRIEIDGRKGWQKALMGYELKRVTLAKDL